MGIREVAKDIEYHSFEEKSGDVRVCTATGKRVQISYHTFGDAAKPLVLFIPGLNVQGVVNYDSALCRWMAAQGFFVVRMDNRDTGLSTKFDDAQQRVHILALLLPQWLVPWEHVPYTLDDMADDAAALIRHLGHERAHVVGTSMGGMIAQLVAIRHPALCRTLTLIMTLSGNMNIQGPSLATKLGFLHAPKSTSDEDLLAFRMWYLETYLCGTPLEDHTIANLTAAESMKRSKYREGAKRHLAAIRRAPPRDEALRKLAIPTHIMHGMLDRLVPVANGYHLHTLIPNSKLSVYPAMGHYIDIEHTQTAHDNMVHFFQQN